MKGQKVTLHQRISAVFPLGGAHAQDNEGCCAVGEGESQQLAVTERFVYILMMNGDGVLHLPRVQYARNSITLFAQINFIINHKL